MSDGNDTRDIDRANGCSSNEVQVFERVRTHLLAQNRQALDPLGMNCVYRSHTDGLSCAVGCLISDAAYSPRIEGIGIVDVGISSGSWTVQVDNGIGEALARALNGSNVPATDGVRLLLLELQRVHDSIEPDLWEGILGTSPEGLQERVQRYLTPRVWQ